MKWRVLMPLPHKYKDQDFGWRWLPGPGEILEVHGIAMITRLIELEDWGYLYRLPDNYREPEKPLAGASVSVPVLEPLGGAGDRDQANPLTVPSGEQTGPPAELSALQGRDLEIVTLWSSGKSAQQIGKRFDVLAKTILNRLSVLRRKYGPGVVSYHAPRPDRRTP